MAIRETVSILSSYFQDEGKSLRRRFGPETVAAAEGIVRLLEPRLQEESPYGSLWDQFKADPESVNARLTGALEAFIEGDPGMAKEINAFVHEFHEAIGSSYERRPPIRGGNVGDNVTETDVVPDTTITGGEKFSWQQGTYLYGDVKSGTEPLSQDVGAGSADYDRQREPLMRSLDTIGIPGLFQQLRETVSEHPALTVEERARLRVLLGEAQEELAKGEDLDTEALIQRLRAVRETAPDVAQNLLDGLAHFASDLGGDIESAIQEMRGSVRRASESE